MQRGAEVVDRFPADAESVMWEFEVASREIHGLLDVGGPYVHGRPGGRFLYLSWGAVNGDEFAMFRRVKLMFGGVPTELLRAARRRQDARRPAWADRWQGRAARRACAATRHRVERTLTVGDGEAGSSDSGTAPTSEETRH